ncbi:MAG: molybdopterin cofactor-binding domain-containing protein [Nitrososphaerota archaeon]|nr:molybdopterin-dependent oxidoreductase [Candidatus Bathyarchaeota archaeon]MDW8023100.1 molybdopterin cofactor-binding domain-containing protein [Nitrososphaerota archaeon]
MVDERRIRKPLKENPLFTFTVRGFPEDPEFRVVGRDVPPKDWEKVVGKAAYVSDVMLPGMLYAKWYLSPHAHAKAKKVDVGEAKALPGVVDVLVCGDPDLAWSGHREGIGSAGEHYHATAPYLSELWDFVLPSEAVREGQPVAVAVCGESPELCDEALKLVKIEWEELPFILSEDEALKPDAPITQHFRKLENNAIPPDTPSMRPVHPTPPRGNIEEGFRNADKVVEWKVQRRDTTSAMAESYSAIAMWKGDELHVWARGHKPLQTAVWLNWMLGIEESKIRFHVTYHGADFGGICWTGMCHTPVLLAAIFAKRTGRPVKVLAEFTPFYIVGEERGLYNFKVGFKKDGTITAVEVKTIGSLAEQAPTEKLSAATSIKSIYGENMRAYVNTGPVICYRHGTQNTLVFNEVINRVAAELGMDPTEVALKNDGCEGEPMHPVMDQIKKQKGFPLRDSLKECIEAGKRAIGWEAKWHPPGAKKLPNGKYHGLGFGVCHQWQVLPGNPSVSAACVIRGDGTAVVMGRIFDILGAKTPICQVFAEESGLRYEDVSLNTDCDIDLFEPGGSLSTACTNTSIMVELGRKVKQRILEIAVATRFFKGKRIEELEIRESIIYEKANPENKRTVAEVMQEFGGAPNFGAMWESNIMARTLVVASGITVSKPPPFYIFARQAHFVEVEVDPETGEIEIKKAVVVNDVGRVINPRGVVGQQFGGCYFGVEREKWQEKVYDPLTGVVLNNNHVFYPTFTMADIFPVDCIAVECGLGYNVYGSCGIGENVGTVWATGPLKSAVYNAIGKWIDEHPLTPDRVLKALGKI